MLAIIKKEVKSYFLTPFGYTFMGLFLFLTALLFFLMNLYPLSPVFSSTISNWVIILIFTIPILTMRLMSEEKKQKTDQLLLTSPVTIRSIIIGKYIAAVIVFTITLLVTIIYPIVMSTYGARLDIGTIFMTYLGFYLLGCSMIAIGLFISASAENQVISVLVSIGIFFLLWILGNVVTLIPSTRMIGIVFAYMLAAGIAAFIYFTIKNVLATIISLLAGVGLVSGLLISNPLIFDGLLTKFFQWFLLLNRYYECTVGTFTLAPVIYFLSLITAFVFLTNRVVEKRRWS